MNNSTQKNSKPLLIATGFLIVGVLAGIMLNLTSAPDLAKIEAELQAVYFADGRPVANIEMMDHNGQPFTEDRFKGKWTFIFFGFTHCPDICPTSLLIMKSMWNKLPEGNPDNVQFIFASVDPDRDTTEILKGYVEHYSKDFIGLRGPHKQLDVLTNQLYALYGYEDVSQKDPTKYTVMHTDKLFVIDPNGTYRAYISSPYTPDSILGEFESIKLLFARDGKLALDINNARIPQAPPTARVMVGYMQLSNTLDKPVEIVAVSSPSFKAIEMHETITEDEVSKMIRHESMVLAANSTAEFKQGGLHLMLFEPVKSLAIGDTINISFRTKAGDTISATFKVEEASLDAGAHDHHDHSHH